jgi:hypothetical protein
MLIMQPLKLRMGFQLKLKLDEEEVVKMRDEIKRNLSKITTILKQVPLCLVLVLRLIMLCLNRNNNHLKIILIF